MISKYRGNRQAISALVRETEVHRDVYLDQELFELEMEHLFANTWIYVGHDSQVPQGRRLLRHHHRRAACHHGARYRRQRKGSLQSLPAQGHAADRRDLRQCRPLLPLPLPCLDLPPRRQPGRRSAEERLRQYGLCREPRRARHDAGAPCPQLSRLRLRASFPMSGRTSTSSSARLSRASTIWSTARRPGKLEVAGGVLRYMHACNWKMLVDNLTDTCHPDDRPSVLGGHDGRCMEVGPGRRQEADGCRDLCAVRESVRILPDHGHPRLGQRPRPYRRVRIPSIPTIRPCRATSTR